VTKRSDMASRYAAAHARREQRRRQSGGRDYLPLAEHPEEPVLSAAPRPASERAATAGGGSMTLRLPQVNYSYLRGDLIRTAVLAVVLFAVMIILSFVIHV
jgi:hypothetical protein